MKKSLMLSLAVAFLCEIQAQDFTDALRYSQDIISGTARFKAMGGAFGALGGDLSAVSLNPASSTIFNSSRGSFTAGNSSINNDVSYFGPSRNFSNDKINIMQGGGVFVYKAAVNSKWNNQ